MYRTKLNAFVKCRVIDLQVTSNVDAPQSPHGEVCRLARRFGNVLGAISSGRAMCCIEAVVGQRKLPLSKRGKESKSEDTD